MRHKVKYTLGTLKRLSTLSQGQTCNLKVNTESTRIWLCRCGVADGLPYDNMVSVERLINGCWEVIETYQAK